jgi:hypothetical protein
MTKDNEALLGVVMMIRINHVAILLNVQNSDLVGYLVWYSYIS